MPKRDVVFLVDGSDRAQASFPMIKSFMTNVATNLDIGRDSIRLAVVQYSDDSVPEFLLNTYTRKSDVVQAIRGLKPKGGRESNTGRALEYVRRNVFTRSSGSRKDEDVPQFLILLTAGRSSDDVRQAAQTLKREDVAPFVIGTRNVDTAEMQQISLSPDYVFKFIDLQNVESIKQYFIDPLTDLETDRIIEIRDAQGGSTDKRDIVFVFDGSDNAMSALPSLRTFISATVDQLDVGLDAVRVAVVQYSDDARVEFLLNDHSTKREVTNAISRLQHKGGREIRIGEVLNYVRNNVFTRAGGSRIKEGVPQFLVLLTAGKSADQVARPSLALKEAGVAAIAIGSRAADDEVLRHISLSPDYIYKVADLRRVMTVRQSVLQPLKILDTVTIRRTYRQNPVDTPSGDKKDIVFLIDGSNNVGTEDFAHIRDFIQYIINNFDIGPNAVRVGLAQYSSNGKMEFTLKQHVGKGTLQNAVRRMRPKGGAPLNMGIGLDFVMKSLFTREAGGRRHEGVPQYLIVINGGNSRDNIQRYLGTLQNSGIYVFGIGAKNVDANELQRIATVNYGTYIVNNFQELKGIQESLKDRLQLENPNTYETPEPPTESEYLRNVDTAEMQQISLSPDYVFKFIDLQNVESIKQYFIDPLTDLETDRIIEIRDTQGGSTDKRDIVFVFDGSDNAMSALPSLRTFISATVDQLDVGLDAVRVAVVQYSDDARVEFLLNDHSTKREVTNAISRLQHKGGREIRIGEVLNYVRNNVFTRAGGSRIKEGVPQFLVLLTAGKSADQVARPSLALKEAGVAAIAIGSRAADDEDLRHISLSPDYIYKVADLRRVMTVRQSVLQPLKILDTVTIRRTYRQNPVDTPSGDKKDIVFLIDGSNNVGTEDFAHIRDFIQYIINNFDIGPNAVRVGLAQYSSNGKMEFTLKQHVGKGTLQNAVRRMRPKGGAPLNMGIGLDFVMKSLFTREAGGRRHEGVPQYLIVINGGNSRDNIQRYLGTLQNSGIYVFGIGAKNVDANELQRIATVNYGTYIVNNFQELKGIQESLKDRLQLENPNTYETPEPPTEILPQSKADIVFILDGSINVGRQNFPHITGFVSNLVDAIFIDDESLQVGVVQYNSDATNEFFLNSYRNREDVLKAIENIVYKGDTTLNVGAALRFVKNNQFIKSAGSRSDQRVPQIAFLIIGGKSNDDAIAAATELKNAGFKIITIGVQDADVDEMNKIASEPAVVFRVADMDTLSELIERVLLATIDIIASDGELCPPSTDVLPQRKADIVFILDGSINVGRQNFPHITGFVSNLVDAIFIDDESLQVGVVQYNSDATNEFFLNSYRNREDVLKAIENIVYKGDTTLNVGAALRFVKNNQFIKSAGSRSDQRVPQIAFLIIGGKSNDDAIAAATELKNAGFKIITIGVQDADVDEMNKIASEPAVVFRVADMDTLSELIERVLLATTDIIASDGELCPPSTDVLPQSKADIVFILDGSINVGRQNFPHITGFVSNLVDAIFIDDESLQVGVVQYNSDATNEFFLNSYRNREDVLKAIENIVYKGDTTLNVGAALRFVKNNQFIKSAGSRSDQRVPQIAFLIIGGKSNDDAIAAATELKNAGFKIITIGVQDADVDEMNKIASEPAVVFRVADMDTLSELIERVLLATIDIIASDGELCPPSTDVLPQSKTDIVFILDGSINVGRQNFPHITGFVSNLVDAIFIDDESLQVGVVQYNSDATNEFFLNSYRNREDVLKAIENIVYKGDTTLNVGAALRFVKNNQFIKSAGSRSDQRVPQIAFLIIGGKSNDDAIAAATELKNAGFKIITIGVQDADVDEMNKIASEPAVVFRVADMDTLSELIERVLLATIDIIASDGELCPPSTDVLPQSKADIVFILDGSINVGRQNFPHITGFVSNLVDAIFIDDESLQVGVVQYNSDATNEFFLNSYRNREDVLKAIENIVYKGDTTLNVGAALRFVKNNQFIKSAGSRSDQRVPQIAFLIIGGKSNDDAIAAATELKNAGFKIITIGVQDADVDEMNKIASEPAVVFRVADMDTLSELIERVLLATIDIIASDGELCPPSTDVLPQSKADIVFILDGSINVGRQNFPHITGFVSNLVDAIFIDDESLQVGVVQYNSDATNEFFLNSYRNREDVLKAIENIVYKGDTTLNVGAALRFVKNNQFIKSAGSRSDQRVPQIAFLIIGGKSNDDAIAAATELKNAGFKIITIGVQDADVDEMNKIASEPAVVFRVADMDTLSELIERVLLATIDIIASDGELCPPSTGGN
ncbi:collagen alpha-3(VI) chain-like [Rhinoraja longicauda]